MAIEKIKAYKLSSGDIIEDKEEANKMEKKLIFDKDIGDFISNYLLGVVDPVDIKDVLSSQSEELILILEKLQNKPV